MTINNFSWSTDSNLAKDMETSMKLAVRNYAKQQGWSSINGFSVSNEGSSSDNIRHYGLKVEHEQNGNNMEIFYQPNISGYKAPQIGSEGHDEFLAGIKYINSRKFESLDEAGAFLKSWVKRLNKLDIK